MNYTKAQQIDKTVTGNYFDVLGVKPALGRDGWWDDSVTDGRACP
mgnify:CR=1 FL=1